VEASGDRRRWCRGRGAENLQTITEALTASDPPPDVADVVEQMGPLDVLGMSYAQDGETARADLTLTFDE
jgi:hypothetical protein